MQIYNSFAYFSSSSHLLRCQYREPPHVNNTAKKKSETNFNMHDGTGKMFFYIIFTGYVCKSSRMLLLNRKKISKWNSVKKERRKICTFFSHDKYRRMCSLFCTKHTWIAMTQSNSCKLDFSLSISIMLSVCMWM